MIDELVAENIHVDAVANLAELCRMSEAIVATTPSSTPILQSDWISPGTHITAVGQMLRGATSYR